MRERERDGERRTMPYAGAARRDVAAVQLDEMLDEGPPDAETAMRAGAGRVGLAESVKNVWQHVGRDAGPGVLDDNLYCAVGAACTHGDARRSPTRRAS